MTDGKTKRPSADGGQGGEQTKGEEETPRPVPRALDEVPRSGVDLPPSEAALFASDHAVRGAPALGARVEETLEGLLDRVDEQPSEFVARRDQLSATERRFEHVSERYDDLYAFTLIGHVTLDAEGRINEINPAAVKLLGGVRADLIGKPLAEFFAPGDRAVLREHLRRTIEGQEEEACALTLVSPHSAAADIELRSVCFEKPGESARMCRAALIDVSKLRQQKRELVRRSQQLRDLAVKLTNVEHDERRRLARVLHDGLQQVLVAAGFSVHALRRQLEGTDNEPLIEKLHEQLGKAAEMAKSLSHELYPKALREEGLYAALVELGNEMPKSHGLHVEVKGDDVSPTSEAVRVFLYSAVRELLFNVVKHAGTSEATVEVMSDSRHVQVAVSDNGVGFDPERLDDARGAFGLFAIRERTEYLGGQMEIHSRPGEGARFVLHIPRQ